MRRGRARQAVMALFLTALALICGVAACSERPAPRFPHAVHLAKRACGEHEEPGCLTCATCHTAKPHSRVPDLAGKCASCHRDDQHAVLVVLETKVERPFGEIAFEHDRHLAMKEINGQCVSCHAGVVDTARPSLPPMSQCFGCHEHEQQWNQGECVPCHAQKDLTRTLPQTFLRHDAAFIRRHGQQASQDKQLCQSCHTQAQCQACHDVSQALSVERRNPEKVERNFVHVGDFLSRHGIEAESQSARCARCHSVESCDGCHLQRGVSANRIDGRSPHPLGWVGPHTDTRNFHGTEARRDILSCASCHDQGAATNCIRCHRVGGYGGNPHPHGWKSSRSKNTQMCGYCHE